MLKLIHIDPGSSSICGIGTCDPVATLGVSVVPTIEIGVAPNIVGVNREVIWTQILTKTLSLSDWDNRINQRVNILAHRVSINRNLEFNRSFVSS